MAYYLDFSADVFGVGSDVDALAKQVNEKGVSGFLCLGRLFQGQPNEAALCI